MGRSTEIVIFPALTRVVFEKESNRFADSELFLQAFPMSIHESLPLSLALFELGHAFYPVFAEFEELFQLVLLGLSLGEPCCDLNSEALYLELDGHYGF